MGEIYYTISKDAVPVLNRVDILPDRTEFYPMEPFGEKPDGFLQGLSFSRRLRKKDRDWRQETGRRTPDGILIAVCADPSSPQNGDSVHVWKEKRLTWTTRNSQPMYPESVYIIGRSRHFGYLRHNGDGWEVVSRCWQVMAGQTTSRYGSDLGLQVEEKEVFFTSEKAQQWASDQLRAGRSVWTYVKSPCWVESLTEFKQDPTVIIQSPESEVAGDPRPKRITVPKEVERLRKLVDDFGDEEARRALEKITERYQSPI